MACLVINGRPCYIIGAGRPAFRDIVQGQRRRGSELRDRPVVEGEKGMLLYVVDINGYARPRGINATVTYRHNAGSLYAAEYTAPRAGTLRQFIMYAEHHRSIATYDITLHDIYAPACNWAQRRSYYFVSTFNDVTSHNWPRVLGTHVAISVMLIIEMQRTLESNRTRRVAAGWLRKFEQPYCKFFSRNISFGK